MVGACEVPLPRHVDSSVAGHAIFLNRLQHHAIVDNPECTSNTVSRKLRLRRHFFVRFVRSSAIAWQPSHAIIPNQHGSQRDGQECRRRSGFGSGPFQVALCTYFRHASRCRLAYWYYRKARGKGKPPGAGTGETTSSRPVDKSQTNHSRSSTDAKDPFERAKAFKNQGNKYFKEGKFDKAIDCYTEAIALCPPQNKNELATFYQIELPPTRTWAIDLNFQYVKALHRRAKAYEIVNELDKCLEGKRQRTFEAKLLTVFDPWWLVR
ncbi:hypothetical protein HPB50_023524 [Hyalomma asiaticum]|uniref:Uncharacterized protein n=1 Tax=Hyalomma asiaticum TaxID=266040 RepID=A0ACB7SCA8_HYAAI|nr:hypothetical protein HPB50_023524 [Hyalomma asiaticum]